MNVKTCHKQVLGTDQWKFSDVWGMDILCGNVSSGKSTFVPPTSHILDFFGSGINNCALVFLQLVEPVGEGMPHGMWHGL